MLKKDDMEDSIFNYFRKRGFMNSELVIEQMTVTEKENHLYDQALKASSKRDAISCATPVRDIIQAEHQFNLFKTWVNGLHEETKVELSQFVMPVLCHMYLDNLMFHSKNECDKFLNRTIPLKYEGWTSFIEQLRSIHSYNEVSDRPEVWYFRNGKCDVKLVSKSISDFRLFLVKNSLHLIIPVLHMYFDVHIVTDDRTNEETEKSLSNGSYTDGFFVPVVDRTMEVLLSEISNKRLQPLPPRPLLLYSANKTEGVVCGRVSWDLRFAATGDKKSQIKIWGLQERRPQTIFPNLHPSYSSSVPVSIETNPTCECHLLYEKQQWFLRGHCDTVYDLSFIRDTDFLVSVSFDTTMRLWSLNDFSCAAVYRGHSSPIWGVAISPILNYVATASHDKTARLWSLEATHPIRIMAGHLQDVTCVKFHPNGSYLATGSVDKTVRLWTITDANVVRIMGGMQNQGAVYCLAFSPNGQLLASGGEDKFVWVWDIATGSVLFQLSGLNKRVVSVDWSQDGSTVAAATYDGDVMTWYIDDEQSSSGNLSSREFSTRNGSTLAKCSTLLSLQYLRKNTLVAVFSMYPFNPGCSRATCPDRSAFPHCYQHCYGQPVLGKLHYEFFHNENFKNCKPCCGMEFYQNLNNLKSHSQKSEIEAYLNNEKVNIFTKPSFSDEYPQYHEEKFKNLKHVVKNHMLNIPQEKSHFDSYFDIDKLHDHIDKFETLSGKGIIDEISENKELCDENEKPHYENELFNNEKIEGNPQLEKELNENEEKLKNLAKVHHENELFNNEKIKNQIQAIEERRKTKESLLATDLKYYSIWADKVKREIKPEKIIKNLNNPRYVRPSQSYGVSMAKDQNFENFWGRREDGVLRQRIRRRLSSDDFCDRGPRKFFPLPKLRPDEFWGPISERFRRKPRPYFQERNNLARDKNYEAWINVLKSNNPGVVLREEKLYEQWLKLNEDKKRMMKDLKRHRNYLQRAKNPNEAFPSVFDMENPYIPRRDNMFCSDSIDEFEVYWPE